MKEDILTHRVLIKLTASELERWRTLNRERTKIGSVSSVHFSKAGTNGFVAAKGFPESPGKEKGLEKCEDNSPLRHDIKEKSEEKDYFMAAGDL